MKPNVIMQDKDRNKEEKEKILKIKWESNAEHIIEWFVNVHRIAILLGRRLLATMNIRKLYI